VEAQKRQVVSATKLKWQHTNTTTKLRHTSQYSRRLEEKTLS